VRGRQTLFQYCGLGYKKCMQCYLVPRKFSRLWRTLGVQECPIPGRVYFRTESRFDLSSYIYMMAVLTPLSNTTCGKRHCLSRIVVACFHAQTQHVRALIRNAASASCGVSISPAQSCPYLEEHSTICCFRAGEFRILFDRDAARAQPKLKAK
jgi:hypothetical protein